MLIRSRFCAWQFKKRKTAAITAAIFFLNKPLNIIISEEHRIDRNTGNIYREYKRVNFKERGECTSLLIQIKI